MSFREKRAVISLLAIWIVAVGYLASVLHATPISIGEAIPGLVSAALALIAIMIGSNVVLVIGAGPEEARQAVDERDRLVQLASRRNMAWVSVAGLWLILILSTTGKPSIVIAYAALGMVAAAEMVMYGSQLLYYRRSA